MTKAAIAIQITVSATILALSIISLFFSLVSGDATKVIHYTGPANDSLIGRPISKNCHEAYPALCPTYHGD